MNKCKAKKLNGERCKNSSLRDSELCFRHDSRTKKEAMRASFNGGKSTRTYVFGESLKLKNPKDIRNLMENSINAIWTGKMPTNNPAGSLGYLAKIFLEAYDKCELESRLEEVERKLEAQQ